jgi:hypothetical protein
MSFTYDPSNDIGKCRLLVHDTTAGTYGTNYEFSDEDINGILEQNGDSVFLAAADMCRILSVKSISSAIVLRIPGALELDKREISKLYMEMATKYENRATQGPDVIIEYVDSFAYGVDQVGRDTGEYIGD